MDLMTHAQDLNPPMSLEPHTSTPTINEESSVVPSNSTAASMYQHQHFAPSFNCNLYTRLQYFHHHACPIHVWINHSVLPILHITTQAFSSPTLQGSAADQPVFG